MSSRAYASLGGSNKRKNALLTAFILPSYVIHLLPTASAILITGCSVVFAVISLLNLFLLAAGSSGAVPFGMSARVLAAHVVSERLQ